MNNNFKNKIPITIITGFLGAGKTSFLKYMLKENHGKRIVIIENEFGEEIGIEGASIIGEKGKKNIEWVELPNGCICCAVKFSFRI
jgi:G3E family GTPase